MNRHMSGAVPRAQEKKLERAPSSQFLAVKGSGDGGRRKHWSKLLKENGAT